MDTLLKNENAVIMYPASCCSNLYAFSPLWKRQQTDSRQNEIRNPLEIRKYSLLIKNALCEIG